MNITYVEAFSDNYIWLLINHFNNAVICVDPGESLPVLRYLEHHQLTLAAILLTHHHYDHINGVEPLIKRYPEVLLYGPADSRIMVSKKLICEKTYFSLGDYTFLALDTPGHTSSAISFYEPKQGLLFCGDTLFSAGCGRIFDGSALLLHNSLSKLKALPNETKVYCGHEYTLQNLRFALTVEPNNAFIKDWYDKTFATVGCTLPSTIGLEKEINPFFRLDKTAVIAYALKNGAKSSDSLTVFTQIREEKNKFIG